MQRAFSTRAAAVRGLALVAFTSLACSASEPAGTRELFTPEHFSINVPDGWRTERELGSIVFVGGSGVEHNTIAVRSVARRGDWVAERTLDVVLPATARALASLPDAAVTPATRLRVGALEGAVYDVTYRPDAGQGARYGRRHAVLVGPERVFHVIHTAPIGALDKTDEMFEAALASLEEEG